MSDPVGIVPPAGDVILEGPWRGSSPSVVRRICGIVWLLGALFCAPMVLVLFPVGGDPAAITAALVWAAVAAVGTVWCLHPAGRIPFPAILTLAGLELAALAVLQRQAGGWESSYYQLIGIHAVVLAACFPVRAAAPFVVAAVAITLLPLVDGGDAGRTVDVGLHTATWLGVCVVGLIAMRRVRGQRLALAADARTDRLTRIGNRYAFEEDVEVVLAAARADGRCVAVGVGDLDGFKPVNDEHGHLAGDRGLRDVASTLVAACEGSGTAYRWAGDEFVAVLVGEDDDDLRRRCAAVSEAALDAGRTPGDVPLRLTFGWARTQDGPDGAALLAVADARLMRVKRARTALRVGA